MTGSAAPVQTGDIVAGKYRVDRILGRGGMGVVVAATHLQLEQRVALKFMLPEVLGNVEAVERFHREARAAAKLKSEHVARIFDVGGLETGALYIVMEYLEGTDLAAVLASAGALPVPQIADYLVQALDALAEAHTVGIVHRDLKPGNLFVTQRADGSALIKVLDFGISKAGPTVTEAALTRTQAVIGSPAYMSPEHMRASRMVDVRSDIWSLGVILYELASGRIPFSADVFSALVLQVAMDPPPPLTAPMPDGFHAIVWRCLEKDPARRFQNVAELAVALGPFAPVTAWPTVERIRKLIGRQPAPAAIGPAVATTRIVPPGTPPPPGISSPPAAQLPPAHTTPLPPPYTPDPSRSPGSHGATPWPTVAPARRSRRTVGVVIAVLVMAILVGTLLAALDDGADDERAVKEPAGSVPAHPAPAGSGPASTPAGEPAAPAPAATAPAPVPGATAAPTEPAAVSAQPSDATTPDAGPEPEVDRAKAEPPHRPARPRPRRHPRQSPREPEDPYATPE